MIITYYLLLSFIIIHGPGPGPAPPHVRGPRGRPSKGPGEPSAEGPAERAEHMGLAFLGMACQAIHGMPWHSMPWHFVASRHARACRDMANPRRDNNQGNIICL